MALEWQDPQDFAKHLKRAATPAGYLMWQLVRNRQRCGVKFRREYVKEPYILDFHCPEAKLCIECDCQPHFTPEGIAKDRARTAWLKAQGIEVIRFTSQEIEQETQRVIDDIDGVMAMLGSDRSDPVFCFCKAKKKVDSRLLALITFHYTEETESFGGVVASPTTLNEKSG